MRAHLQQPVRRRDHGFALLMTLLLLVVAATAMTAMARRSLDETIRAAEAERNLQRRWAWRTCRDALLPRVEQVLTDEEAAGDTPVAMVRIELTLAGERVELVLTDEQAKANVNALLNCWGRVNAEQRVRRLVAASSPDAIVRLRPAPTLTLDANQGRVTPPIISFDQVCVNPAPPQLVGDAAQFNRGVASNVTCWGDGRVNVRRASRTALGQVCQPWLGPREISRLLSLRDAMPGAGVGYLLDQLDLTRQRRQQVGRLLTDQSNCRALWIIVRDDDRAWYELHVTEQAAGAAGSRPTTFRW